jgi:diaminohydroxyphosphoribosylaminopyrimidine deaminase/5-amino-6-(5-phosphoribosylamino)uracil reductase
MREAFELARGGLESVSPNPMVGVVIVKGGRVVGRGFHSRFGGPHAEVEALAATRDASGADVYVSLEPCGHHGKTPPCADALIEAKVARVFYSAADPNPETYGKGPRRMRKHGIEVRGRILLREGLELNAPYFHWRRTGRPWVILKWAMTLDGKIATVGGESKWITGARARNWAHGVRRRVDAIVVGTRTALVDDPRLTPRPARGRKPLRIVLDRRGRLPLELVLLDENLERAGSGPRLYVVGKTATARRRREVERRGLEVLVLTERRGQLDLEALLDVLGERGVSQILVEGGGDLVGSFVDKGLVQELIAFIAPRVFGGREAPTAVGGRGFEKLADTLKLERVEQQSVGDDLIVRGVVSR